MASTAPDDPPVRPIPSPTSSSVADLLDSFLPSTALKAQLDQHAQALLACRVQRNTRRQVDQLRGELRDDFASRAWVVKADWMARIVPEHRDEADDAQEGTGEGHAGMVGGRGSTDSSPPSSPTSSTRPTASLPPTILSDTDGAATMARRVDDTVEGALATQVDEARGRIEASVRRSEAMELELWLGHEILEAVSTAGGDEGQAARLVLERLEDVCFEESVPLV
ncbi:hypothetical protein JCM9279_005406 [Rhodotorula babjevae]